VAVDAPNLSPAAAMASLAVRLRGLVPSSMAAAGRRSFSIAGSRRVEPIADIAEYASKRQTGVNMQALLSTGMGLMLDKSDIDASLPKEQRTLIQIAQFLHHELPIRLAHRAIELEELPHGLSDMPSVQTVRDWYVQSFNDIISEEVPATPASEARFEEVLNKIYDRHAPTLLQMARGVHEFKRELRKRHRDDPAGLRRSQIWEYPEVHQFLDAFYVSRIGIRILIGQYLELHHPQEENYVGLINTHTSPSEIAEAAIEDARYMCERQYGDAPDVEIKGRLDLTFSYIPSHLYYMLFEVIKNSLRAVCEHHGVDSDMPNVRVIIADGEQNEDVVIKVSDEGGGIARSHSPRIWSYLFTTAKPAFENSNENGSDDTFPEQALTDSPLAGLGYGLPTSRAYARYFGGDLNIMSMEGYGTDAFLHLSRLGNRNEPLP